MTLSTSRLDVLLQTLRAASLVALFVSAASLHAAQPYHLTLEANPASAFPFLGKFGSVDLHVYQGGVRADGVLMNAFSKNGQNTVTVENSVSRTHSSVPLGEIGSTIRGLSGDSGMKDTPVLGATLAGRVGTMKATRHRLIYGPTAYIDVWTSTEIPYNAQLSRIVEQLLQALAPGTAPIAKTLPGTPLYVELNFRRFPKTTLLKLKSFTWGADDEADALKVGGLYF
jgi:hypothetical protein